MQIGDCKLQIANWRTSTSVSGLTICNSQFAMTNLQCISELRAGVSLPGEMTRELACSFISRRIARSSRADRVSPVAAHATGPAVVFHADVSRALAAENYPPQPHRTVAVTLPAGLGVHPSGLGVRTAGAARPRGNRTETPRR